MLATILISIVLAALFVAAILYAARRGTCAGCSEKGSCPHAGACSGCSHCTEQHTRRKENYPPHAV